MEDGCLVHGSANTAEVPAIAGRPVPQRLVEGLATLGYYVFDDFLGKESCITLREVLRLSRVRGELKLGRVGPSTSVSEELALRSDIAACIEPGWNPSVDVLLFRLRSIVAEAAALLPELHGGDSNLVLHPAAVQGAVYPGEGSFYLRHVDNPGSDATDKRLLTTVYYCNPDWKPTDGGALRLHWAEGASCAGADSLAAASEVSGVPLMALRRSLGGTHDVEPLGDRLVVFWADHRMPHEVLPSTSLRYAISAWWDAPALNGENPLHAACSVPQRLALKQHEFRPEFLKACRSAAQHLALRRPVRVPGFLAHGICPLSRRFGPEATLAPAEMRAGLLALSAVAAKAPETKCAKWMLDQNGGRGTPMTAVPLLRELVALLDKVVYVIGSAQVANAAPAQAPIAALREGGRTEVVLVSHNSQSLEARDIDVMPHAELRAIFFMWGLPGWSACFHGCADGSGREQMEVSAGDLWFVPAARQLKFVKSASKRSGGEAGTDAAARWLEVWFFGEAPLPSAEGTPVSSKVTAASRAREILALELLYTKGEMLTIQDTPSLHQPSASTPGTLSKREHAQTSHEESAEHVAAREAVSTNGISTSYEFSPTNRLATHVPDGARALPGSDVVSSGVQHIGECVASRGDDMHTRGASIALRFEPIPNSREAELVLDFSRRPWTNRRGVPSGLALDFDAETNLFRVALPGEKPAVLQLPPWPEQVMAPSPSEFTPTGSAASGNAPLQTVGAARFSARRLEVRVRFRRADAD